MEEHGRSRMEEQSRRKKRKRSRTRKCRPVALLCLAGAVVVLAGVWVVCNGIPFSARAGLDIRPEGNARQGSIYSRETKEISDGDFWVVLNQLPIMEEGGRDCNIRYENPASNHYAARISLYLDESGSLLGSTTRVDPGYYVETVPLNQTLPAGEYPVTARIELFEDKNQVGEMTVRIMLQVIGTEKIQAMQEGQARQTTWVRQIDRARQEAGERETVQERQTTIQTTQNQNKQGGMAG